MHETEVEGGDTALPPPHLTHLELRSDKVTPPALQGGLALSDEVGQVQVAAPVPAAPAVRNCRKCKMPTRGHSGPTGLDKCSVSLTSPEHLRDSSLSLPPSFPSPVREKREEPATSTPQSLPPPSPSDVISPTSSTSPFQPLFPQQESLPAPSHQQQQQQQPLPPSFPPPSLPAPPSQQWPFPDSEEVIQCLCCERDGFPGNMFVGNFAIANHIVFFHKEFNKCAHCKCSLPDEDGVFIAHMEECGPCPGYPRCPFEADQCPYLSVNPP